MLLDTHGVITDSARVHAAAAFLEARGLRPSEAEVRAVAAHTEWLLTEDGARSRGRSYTRPWPGMSPI
ncbi:hypothetical protein [Streptomyces sp. NPDC090798]|uniref:hypothetical protein n=1 Tax=Streptomyces sp. NPDC090798 TaxID=3365968 RepID=UPI003817F618